MMMSVCGSAGGRCGICVPVSLNGFGISCQSREPGAPLSGIMIGSRKMRSGPIGVLTSTHPACHVTRRASTG